MHNEQMQILPPRERRESRIPASRGSLRLLVVDDMPENLTLLEDVLGGEGYEVVSAADGVEALEHLRSGPVHLIVADAMMPKMDGFTLCREVRSNPRWKQLPIVIFTGNYVAPAEQAFARSLGVDRYVLKYAGIDALLDAVRDVARERYGDARPVEGRSALDDRIFLEQHRAIVMHKLEEKTAELERYAQALNARNRQLQLSEEKYRRLFEQASVAIIVADQATGRVVDINPRGTALLGYSREEIESLPALPFEDASFWSRVRESAHFTLAETSLRTKTAGVIDVEVAVGPMTSEDGRRMLLYLRDVTEQKRMRDQLLQLEKMTLLGRLAAGIAHEIRNPLSAVTLNLQYLAQKLEESSGLCDAARDALEGAQRVNAVIENTLSLARVSPPVLRRENINDLVAQTLGFMRVPMRQKSLTISTDLAPGLPEVAIDAKQVLQVLLNIAQNAIDASPEEGSILIATRGDAVRLPSQDDPQDAVVVSVRDHGSGFTPQQKKQAFQEFFTTKAGGTGLGLALSRQIMDRHAGDIRIEPAEGGGTVVELVFPVRNGHERR